MNTFIEVLNALELIASEPSTTAKVKLVDQFCVHEIFRLVLKYALEDSRNYHMTKLPDKPIYSMLEDTEDIFNQLEYLTERSGASNSDKATLAVMAAENKSSWEVVTRIIKKDLRCGVSAGIVNKARPGLITTWPYMRCMSFSEKNMKRIKYPAQIENKADGAHIDIVLKGKKVRFASRKGRNMTLHGFLDANFTNIDTEDDLVFIGEGRVLDPNGNIYDRKTGNGIINKAIKGTITPEEASRVILTLWDVVPHHSFMEGLCLIPHDVRFARLKELFPKTSIFLQIIKHKMVGNEEEALEFFKEIRKGGGEGAIIKNRSGVFKHYTSPDQVKIKAEFEAEFKVIGWAPGKPGTKYEHYLGAIQVTSLDETITSWVGSGFSDEERKGELRNEIVGKIVTIKFESIIRKKTSTSISLYLPRFIEVRLDKNDADDLPYILELTEGK
jgi:ATP-dependent DNA ligase